MNFVKEQGVIMNLDEASVLSPKFKEGDVVRLMSGGPKMTVSVIARDLKGEFKGNYICEWFAENKLERATFVGKSLALCGEPQK